jgi:MOSC domain-containing protein YiiM
MNLISVNVGLPRRVEHNGEPVATGIYKSPVAERVKVNQLNLEGDGQADLRVHGGFSKAVYAYPFEHYEFWQREFPETDLPFGIFGENLTTQGLFETEVCIGDKFRIGTAEFMVTEPRFPCFKLGIRFGRTDIIRRFQKSLRSGFYLAVLRTGEIGAGDKIEIISRDENKVTVEEIVKLKEQVDAETLRRALKTDALPMAMKLKFQLQLSKLEN